MIQIDNWPFSMRSWRRLGPTNNSIVGSKFALAILRRERHVWKLWSIIAHSGNKLLLRLISIHLWVLITTWMETLWWHPWILLTFLFRCLWEILVMSCLRNVIRSHLRWEVVINIDIMKMVLLNVVFAIEITCTHLRSWLILLRKISDWINVLLLIHKE
jgi:hypothetical protein